MSDDQKEWRDHQKDEGDDVEAHAAAAAAFNEPDEDRDATEEPPDVEGHSTHPTVHPNVHP